MELNPLLVRFLLALGLSFFFGLAFEEFYVRERQVRPGGVRTFPLLALAGALLYRLDAERLLPLALGLLMLGAWLAVYYWRHCGETDAEGRPNVGLVVPICNVLAFLIGPIALAEPPWVAVGATVFTVLLLTGRARLHEFAQRIEIGEVVTAGKFLILTGLILPLLPDEPVTHLTAITPYQVWLAVVAICSLSYASYLLQRYVAPASAGLWVAVLGGLYSSTATTVVLARRMASQPQDRHQAQVGIMLATSIMYVRVLVIVALFNRPLASALMPWLLILSAFGCLGAALWYRRDTSSPGRLAASTPLGNPLELNAALVFAALFVAISLASSWSQTNLGTAGLYALAAVLGFTDIDPFVLGLAEGSAPSIPVVVGTAAVLIAASSNNLLKATYAASFAGFRAGLAPAVLLLLLAAGGIGIALFLTWA
jgi:uncharacterized membrane protein (DUF4010 family)